MGKFTNKQRDDLRQLVVETEVQRLNRHEAKAYIIDKFGQDISYETIDKLKASIKKNALTRLNELQKSRTAFIDQYFQRIDEILKYQRYQWELHNRNPDKPLIQKLCLQELHALTVTLTNLYDALPGISEYIAREIIPKDQQMGRGDAQEQESDGDLPSGLTN